MQLFDYAISNPPYQIEINGNDNAANNTKRKQYRRIYDKFQILASQISLYTTMIYPTSWQSNNSVNYWKTFINLGLKSSNNINGTLIFDQAIESDYFVSITIFEKDYAADIRINDSFNLPLDSDYWIDSADKWSAYHATRNYGSYLQAPHYTSDLKNVLSLDNVITFEPYDEEMFDHAGGSLTKIYIKYRPSPAPDSNYWLVPREQIVNRVNELDKINITVNQGLFIQRRWFNEICERDDLKFELKLFKINECFGRTLMCLRSFPKDDITDAKNFMKYFNTHFIKMLVSLEPSAHKFATLVPDLEDYSDNAPLFMSDDELGAGHEYYGLSLNDRLVAYFNG